MATKGPRSFRYVRSLVKLITHHLGTHSKKKTRKILVQLRNITGLLRAGLHYRKRPTHGEKEESLRIVARATRELLLALEAMDADTRRLLESEADQCPDEVDIVIDEEQVGYQVSRRPQHLWGSIPP
jgi:hypothetical protein